MMKFWTGFIVVLIFYSCNFSEKEVTKTYFGGQIINPKTDYVIFYQLHNPDFKVRDTFKLDSENKFFHTYEDLQPGFYSFDHGNEYQNVFLDPGDSIWLRLNTDDFDESLVFSGKGSKKNNYLQKLYINHDNMGNFLKRSSDMEPEPFMKFIDSIRQGELKDLDHFVSHKPQSEEFYKIAKANIDYAFYKWLEYYPFGHYGNTGLTHYQDLPENFYSYRDSVNLNNTELGEVRYYLSYLQDYIMNAALEEVYQHEHHHIVFDRNSIPYNLRRLELIDSLIDHKDFKNYLLHNAAFNYVRAVNDSLKYIAITNKYLALSSEDNDVKNVFKNWVDAKLALETGKSLPNAELFDIQGQKKNLKELVSGKPTLIHLWSTYYKRQSISNHNKTVELRKAYPDLNILSIDYSNTSMDHWITNMKTWPIMKTNEFKFANPLDGSLTYDSVLNKVILVDRNGRIISSKLNIFSSKLPSLIEKLLNK